QNTRPDHRHSHQNREIPTKTQPPAVDHHHGVAVRTRTRPAQRSRHRQGPTGSVLIQKRRPASVPGSPASRAQPARRVRRLAGPAGVPQCPHDAHQRTDYRLARSPTSVNAQTSRTSGGLFVATTTCCGNRMVEKDIARCHPHRVPVTTAELHGSHEMSTAPLTETTSVEVYDTTLRDGAQQEGMNLS